VRSADFNDFFVLLLLLISFRISL